MKNTIKLMLIALFVLAGFSQAADMSTRYRLEQEQSFRPAAQQVNPLGDVIYVDSSNGNTSNNGLTKANAISTITRALQLAQAGDTIICSPGGSETVTATLAVSSARIRIICPTANGSAGFTVTGAGTLDLMTVSAANVTVSGLGFAHTGATSSAAGILTTTAADGLSVVNCVFDDSAIVTNFTGFGVEVTNACDKVLVKDCKFIDCHRGVNFVIANSTTCKDVRIIGNTFWVGRATAFGVCSTLTGSGAVVGLEVLNNIFIEANGDGSAATDAWDGTNGTDGASGPLSFGAAVDRYIVAGNMSYAAADVSFDLNLAINAGAAGNLVANYSGSGGDLEDKIDVVDGLVDTLTTNLATANTAIGTINATTTDNINGKIGTDTEMADNSLYDLLGGGTKTLSLSAALGTSVDATTTDSLHGKIGTDTEMADNSLYDLLGAGSATLSISAALGTSLDATTTDSLHGKIGTDTELADRSVFDILAGDGPAAWPAAAAPANDVSIAEAIRYIAEQQGYRSVSNAIALGAAATTPVFTVTGCCEVRVVGVVTADVIKTGGAVTLEVGTSDSTAAIIAQMADADGLALADIYVGATAANVGALPAAAVVNADNIDQLTGADCTSGQITYYCFWKPITSNGAVATAP